ncbi:DUF2798 domain-containing protein [Roseobacter sp. YSTF-M11]|uniref:DUF2798 domain-containing protein n=1 Tax=Roseobacter insulae TaxID=2859783 RepID=A0A9X1FSB9_9RHOB|nr:DUF2798 domain-containing protein [Roseobacter insulae]MBW4706881.1 DUF2798 domain-containing protein [Roseobacter insulae]
MIPARYAYFVFGFVLSGLMSMMVSGIATYRTVGMIDGFVTLWLGNWLPSWMVAYPTLLVVSPIARRLVAKLTRLDA